MKKSFISLAIIALTLSGCTMTGALKSFQTSLTTGCLNIGTSHKLISKESKTQWSIGDQDLKTLIAPLSSELTAKGIDVSQASFSHKDNIVYNKQDCKGDVVKVSPEATKNLMTFFYGNQ